MFGLTTVAAVRDHQQMKMSLNKSELLDYLIRQANYLFPDNHNIKKLELMPHLDLALNRVEFCFSKINSRYFYNGTDVLFNHLHGDQYAMFLYFISNTIYRSNGNVNISAKLFQLNRCLHGIDAFYEVDLPDIFLFVHPLGTVLGRGSYANYFLVYQRCGIGSNHEVYPSMKEFVTLRPGSSILGNCRVEENCTIAAESLLLDRNLEKNSVYIGSPRDYLIKEVKDVNQIWRT
jgi:serine O-acetyltransferase